MRMPWSGDKEGKKPEKRQSITDVLFSRFKMHWWLLGVISALAVTWIAFPMEEQRKPLDSDDFRLGDRSKRDVFAQLDVVYSDEEATAAKKREASTEVPPIFNIDFERLENAKEEFGIVRKTRAVKARLGLRFIPVLDSEKITEELREKLDKGDEQFSLSQDVGISIVEAGSEWLISSDDKEMYVVRKEENELNTYLTDAKKINRMKRAFYIGPSNEVGSILATVSDKEIDAMEKEVIELLSGILVKGVIHGGEDSSFVKELSGNIEYIKDKWEQTRKDLEQQTGKKPLNSEIAAMMHVTLVDTRSKPSVEKTVAGEELLLWLEATNEARDRAREMKYPISVVVEDFCVYLMRPNIKYDPVLTQDRQANLRAGFPLVRRTIPKEIGRASCRERV